MNVILSDLRQQKIKKIKNALTTKKLFIFGGGGPHILLRAI